MDPQKIRESLFAGMKNRCYLFVVTQGEGYQGTRSYHGLIVPNLAIEPFIYMIGDLAYWYRLRVTDVMETWWDDHT